MIPLAASTPYGPYNSGRPLLLGPDGQPLPLSKLPILSPEAAAELVEEVYAALPADVRRRAERALASIARLNGVLARHFYLEGWHGGFW